MARVLKRKSRNRGAVPRDIPQRELRNDISRVLAAVERGERFRVTVRGRPVAEIVPATSRRTSVPWAEVMDVLRRTPLDKRFMADVDGAVDNKARDPWKRS
jgi:prevent-host-death family protein